ncbi:MAG: hypothetical protein D6811_03045 [Alphaproteobacteria bacterium]|nr:MAG: hypothetical protein D6811_03045 [Alphaproteobacteria bacterium]
MPATRVSGACGKCLWSAWTRCAASCRSGRCNGSPSTPPISSIRPTRPLRPWHASKRGPNGGHFAPEAAGPGTDSDSGRHHQDSIQIIKELEPCAEDPDTRIAPVITPFPAPARRKKRDQSHGPSPNVPLPAKEQGDEHAGEPAVPPELVLKACPDIVDYSPYGIRHLHQLAGAAERLRSMMGISAEAWSEACRIMGVATASVTLAAILQRGAGRASARPGDRGAFSRNRSDAHRLAPRLTDINFPGQIRP